MFERTNARTWSIIAIICMGLMVVLAYRIGTNDTIAPNYSIAFTELTELIESTTNQRLDEMNQELQSQWEMIDELLRTINNLEDGIPIQEQPFSHGLTPSQVRQAFLKALETEIDLTDIIPGQHELLGKEFISVNERYVLIRVDRVMPWENVEIEILFSYEVDGLGSFTTITWTPIVMHDIWTGIVDIEERTPRQLTQQEVVTVQFAYHCLEIDPSVNLLPEAFLYNSVDILGEDLWREFIRLMYEHTSISVWDLWVENNKLYVDLVDSEAIFFDWGSTGSAYRGIRLNNTLISLVDSLEGVNSYEVLVGGIRGVFTSHWSFVYIFYVEDGVVVGVEAVPGFEHWLD